MVVCTRAALLACLLASSICCAASAEEGDAPLCRAAIEGYDGEALAALAAAERERWRTARNAQRDARRARERDRAVVGRPSSIARKSLASAAAEA